MLSHWPSWLLPNRCIVSPELPSAPLFCFVDRRFGTVYFRKRWLGVLGVCLVCCTQEKLSFCSGHVCSSFSVETSELLQAFIWTGQHRQVFQFFSALILSYSRFVLFTLSSSPCKLLSSTLRQVWHELSTISKCLTLRLQWVPGHSFLPGNDTANELAKMIDPSCFSLFQPLSVYRTSSVLF